MLQLLRAKNREMNLKKLLHEAIYIHKNIIIKSFASPVDETYTSTKHILKFARKVVQVISGAQNLFFISCGETGENLIESKKIDVHGMPNSREKAETSYQNGSLMRHFGTCSCNEIRATFVPFARNCQARISSSWGKSIRTCGILEYIWNSNGQLPPFVLSLLSRKGRWFRKIISRL